MNVINRENKKLKYFCDIDINAYQPTHREKKKIRTFQHIPKQVIMAFTLMIKRAFGDNKVNGTIRRGTTEQQVKDVMSQFGDISKIDMRNKKDRHNGENFRIFFIHYENTDHFEDEILEALNDGESMEVDNDDYKHFWVVCKYIAKKTKEFKPRGVRIRRKTENKRPTPPPLEMLDVSPMPDDMTAPNAPIGTPQNAETF